MKPKPHVQLQALATLLASVAAVGLLGYPAAITIAPALTLGAAIWSWFALLYRRRRRGWPATRSHDRAAKDSVMVQCLVLGLLAPAAIAWSAVALGAAHQLVGPPVSDSQAVIVALCVVLVPLSMLVSSSVDWYLIRAFREGVHGEPVCRSWVADSEASMNYVNYWVMHRFVCEIIVWAAITVAIAFVSAIAEGSTRSETGRTTLNLVGLLGIIGWTTREASKVRPAIAFLRYPSVGLGQWVSGVNGEHEPIAGFVLDVSLDPGVQLIQEPRGHPCRDISYPRSSVPLRDRERLTVTGEPHELCVDRCEFWVPDCDVGLRELEIERLEESGDDEADARQRAM